MVDELTCRQKGGFIRVGGLGQPRLEARPNQSLDAEKIDKSNG